MGFDFDWDLAGLGAFLFGATLVGQALAQRADVKPVTWFWLTFVWGTTLGGFAALSVEHGELVWRLAGSAGAAGAAFVSGSLITWGLARRGWLQDQRQQDARRFQQDVALLGGAIAASAGALAGGAGGFSSSGMSLVAGFFAPLAILFVVVTFMRRQVLHYSILLVGPNIAVGAALGGLIGAALTSL